MDKIALSKRLAGFSEVFKQETKFARDLKAMSLVIESLPEEKFASLIIEAEEAKKDEKEEEKEDMKEAAKKVEEPKEEEAEKPEVEASKEEDEKEEEVEEKEASGTFWNKEASQAVISYLMRDVLGEEVKPVKKASAEPVPSAKLPAAQTPDGKGNKPASTLKKDQVPNMEPVIKSDIVQKSHGSVRKEASNKTEGTVIHSEGVELTASMDEVNLDPTEMKKLQQLFN